MTNAVLEETVCQDQCVQINDDTIRRTYNYVKKLVALRYKTAIEALQSRHIGYEEEDFIQEVMQILLKELRIKKFESFGKFKAFIKLSASWHYLHEKRKYFYTKSRGSCYTVSLEKSVNDGQTLGDTLGIDEDTEKYNLHFIMKKKLYVKFDWKTYKVGKLADFRNDKKGILLSVNHFIRAMQYYGMKDTCNYYKQNGFYMTRNIFNNLSQAIINYAKDTNLLEKEHCMEYSFAIQKDEKRAVTEVECECGYIREIHGLDGDYWQCPNCGRIHDKLDSAKHKLGLLEDYVSNMTKRIELKVNKSSISKMWPINNKPSHITDVLEV